MPDHLDYIRICGLEGGDLEVFQGQAGGGAAATSAGTAAGTAATSENWLEQVIQALAESWVGLSDWLSLRSDEAVQADADDTEEEGDTRSLGRSLRARMLPAIPVAGALTALGAGGAITAVAAASAIHGITSEIIESLSETLDFTSERWRLYGIEQRLYGIEQRLQEIREILRSAWLKKTLNPLDDEKSLVELAFMHDEESILKLALLFVEDEQTKSVLNERLKDLLGVDMQIETNDLKVSTKTGVIEYA